MRLHVAFLPALLPILVTSLLLHCETARANLYFEFGTGIGSFRNANSFFGTSVSSKSGFSGNLSAYTPVLGARSFARIDLGIQTRFSSTESNSGSTLSFGSANIGLRAEIWRFYVGAGYSPINFVSEKGAGLLGLHTYPSNSSYFVEGGAIWRVIPEFQIVAALSLEYGTQGSPSPITEYGLRFRFPLSPKEGGSSPDGSFDGFRYPFGIMK
jgi:hypothetical protein